MQVADALLLRQGAAAELWASMLLLPQTADRRIAIGPCLQAKEDKKQGGDRQRQDVLVHEGATAGTQHAFQFAHAEPELHCSII